MVRIPLIPAGMSTSTEKCPMPSTKGVYRPSGMSRVEKLIPGAMILKARQNPQNRYHVKLGVMVTEALLNAVRRANTASMAVIMEKKDLFVRPICPASRHREGSIPAIRPTNRQTEGAGYFSRK